MKFGDVLRLLLDEHNLSQKEFAKTLNLAASTISSYVQNVRQPDFETLCQIAAYFNVSTDYLLSYNSSSTSDLEGELLRVFRTMSPQEQKIYIEQGKAFYKLKK